MWRMIIGSFSTGGYMLKISFENEVAKNITLTLIIFGVLLVGLPRRVQASTHIFPPNRSAILASLQLGELATFAAIQQAVQSITQQLTNVGVSLGGQAQGVVGQASQELNFRLQQLRELVRDNINAPIASLGLDVQELARQITSSLQQLEAIINGQRECLNQNAEILLSTVSNITQELKRGVPLIRGAAPQISYFQFEGLPARSVPISGGRMTIFGNNLWPKPDLPPTVTLLSADRTRVLQALTPQRAATINNISAVVNDSVIREHAGECLQLKVQARNKTGIWPFRRTTETELFLPVCVSQSFKTEFVVEAGLTYDVTETITQTLSAQEFRQDNADCRNGQNINIQKIWDLPSGPNITNSRIVSIGERQGEFHRHGSNATASIATANVVIMSGSIDRADCTRTPFGDILHSTAIFQRWVTPTVQFDRTNSFTSSAQPVRVAMSFPNTQIRVLIPKERASPSTTFWFTISRLVNGVVVERRDAPRTPVNASGGTSPALSMGNLQIAGRLNPTPVGGNAELLITVTAPPCAQ
jgi:hypothetical protein